MKWQGNLRQKLPFQEIQLLGNDKKHRKQQTPTPRNPVFGKWQRKQRSFPEIRPLGNDKRKCKTINFQLQNSDPEKL